MASDSKSPPRFTFVSFLASQEPFEILDETCSYLGTAEPQVLRRGCKRYYEVTNYNGISTSIHYFVPSYQTFRDFGLIYESTCFDFELGVSKVSVMDLFVEIGSERMHW